MECVNGQTEKCTYIEARTCQGNTAGTESDERLVGPGQISLYCKGKRDPDHGDGNSLHKWLFIFFKQGDFICINT